MPARDPLAYVSQGQTFQVQADTWNAFIDAARAYLDQKIATALAAHHAQHAVALVKNSTGADLDAHMLVGLDYPRTPNPAVPIYDTTDAETTATFEAVPNFEVFDAGGQDDEAEPFAVVLEPIPDGGVGPALVAGIVHVEIEVSADADAADWTYVRSHSHSRVKCHPGGWGRILWRESGNGNKQGYIVFPATPPDLDLLRDSATDDAKCRLLGHMSGQGWTEDRAWIYGNNEYEILRWHPTEGWKPDWVRAHA